MIHDYNRFMGGVDRNDEMIANYNSVRKSMKWTKKVAFHFTEIALSGHHFPELIPPTPMKQNPQKRCVVCTRNKKRKESRMISMWGLP